MKVNELMIGDWIEDGYKKAQVTSITCDGIVETTAAISDIEVVDPIPLTEEILARNFGGYDHIDYDKEGRCPCYFVGNRRIYVGHNECCFYFCHKDDWAGIHDIEIHYVHELQHILRLCNIDKEISI